MHTEELDDLYLEAMELFDAGDKDAALHLFRQGADLGDDWAMNCIGLAYAAGNGVKQDKQMAIEWLKKSWRTGRQASICMNIAITYEELGQRRLALYWWNKAVAGGDIEAGLGLAKCLLQATKGRPTERIMKLVQATAGAEGHVEVTLAGKEEAQALLKELTNRSTKIQVH